MTIRLYFPKWKLLLRAAIWFAVVGPLIPASLGLFNPVFLIAAWITGGLPAALAGVFFAMGTNLLQVANPGHVMSRKQTRALAAALGALSGLLAVIPFWLFLGSQQSMFGLVWGSWLMPVLCVPSAAICGALFDPQIWPTDEALTAV